MCGIAGYIGNKEINSERIDSCLKLMWRRGPDSSECIQHHHGDQHIYLLNSRLSIIDLNERANLPFRIGSYVMAYNGELYNYIERKHELISEGCRLMTEGDTEVLLQTVIRKGWQGLDRCEGMWAFAVYNQEEGSLLLSRDRFGEKPLYIYRDSTGLYFGSESKFIFELLGRVLPVNHNHLYRYMVNGYKALYKTHETFFVGLEELSPGSVLHLDGNGVETREVYWQPAYEQDDSLSYDEVVKLARQALVQTVKLRLRADVPMAFCMSGGVDSISLISLAKRVFDYDVHGFTIVNTDARYEEQDMVEYAVKELGIQHTAIHVDTRDFLPKLNILVHQHDAPVYTITYFAHWLLMASIHEHGYRISLSGTGADELFTGYFDHHLFYLYEICHEADLHDAARQAWIKRVQPLVRNPFLKDPDIFIRKPALRDHVYLDSDGFAQYLNRQWNEPFFEEKYSSSLLRNRMLNELFHEAVPVILHEDDLNAMYYSIENRSPYLDRGLFELSNRIPSRHLIRDGFAKAILRDSMRGIVPPLILDNPRKVGFNAPIFSFLDVHRADVRDYLLSDSPVFQHVKHDKIAQLINQTDLPNSQSKFLFYFLNTKLFLEEFGG